MFFALEVKQEAGGQIIVGQLVSQPRNKTAPSLAPAIARGYFLLLVQWLLWESHLKVLDLGSPQERTKKKARHLLLLIFGGQRIPLTSQKLPNNLSLPVILGE